jgi:hypothetical protein
VRFIKFDHIQCAAGKVVYGSFALTLKQLTAEQRFDYYRIRKLVVQFRPQRTAATPSNGELLSATCQAYLDFDDSSTPTAVDFTNRQNLQFWQGNRFKAMSWVPKVNWAVESGQSIQEVPAAIKTAPWLNLAYNEVKHFGLKYALSAAGDASAKMDWVIVVKAYVQFKQPYFAGPTQTLEEEGFTILAGTEMQAECGAESTIAGIAPLGAGTRPLRASGAPARGSTRSGRRAYECMSLDSDVEID